jgi:hypothetical protein
MRPSSAIVFQMLFQDQGAVVFLIVRRINQCDGSFLALVEQEMDLVGLLLQFFLITPTKLFPFGSYTRFTLSIGKHFYKGLRESIGTCMNL